MEREAPRMEQAARLMAQHAAGVAQAKTDASAALSCMVDPKLTWVWHAIARPIGYMGLVYRFPA